MRRAAAAHFRLEDLSMNALELGDIMKLASTSRKLVALLREPTVVAALKKCQVAEARGDRFRAMWRSEAQAAASAQVDLAMTRARLQELQEENTELRDDFSELREARLEERAAWKKRVGALELQLAEAKRARIE